MRRGLSRLITAPFVVTLLFAGSVVGCFLLIAELSRDRDAALIDAHILRAADLDRAIPELRFHDTPWFVVMDDISKRTGVPIRHTDAAREIAATFTCTTRLRNVKLRKVLRTLFESADPARRLGWCIDAGGDILIATAEELASRRIERDYSVRDLLVSIPIDAFSSDSEITLAELMRQITALIRETIEVGSWQNDGGTIGTLVEDPATLTFTVTHTPECHFQIENLLDKLRDQRAIDTPTVRLWAARQR